MNVIYGQICRINIACNALVNTRRGSSDNGEYVVRRRMPRTAMSQCRFKNCLEISSRKEREKENGGAFKVDRVV